MKTYNQTMTKTNGVFKFSENYNLPKKGTYYMKVQLVCYKGSVKKETINKTTSKQTYS